MHSDVGQHRRASLVGRVERCAVFLVAGPGLRRSASSPPSQAGQVHERARALHRAIAPPHLKAISLTLPLFLPSPLARALLDHHPSRSTSSTSHSQGFADPMNNNRPFIYPSNTGIAYSFTDDGYFETAWYRFQANGACSRSSSFGSCPSFTQGHVLMHVLAAVRSLQAGVPDGHALLAARHRVFLLPSCPSSSPRLTPHFSPARSTRSTRTARCR